MSFLLHQARFLVTVNHLRDLPPSPLPEVAFAGRSNAGKSSAINVLCNQRRLAFASKTPGRTQHINYFSVGPADQPRAHLIDLPGYGYAEVPASVQIHWEQLLGGYLQTRTQLCGLILLMDARRPCMELDWQMIDWFASTGKPIHMLLTKADKLTRQASINTLRTVQQKLAEYTMRLGLPNQLTVQLFSTLKRVGLDDAQHTIEAWLKPTHQT